MSLDRHRVTRGNGLLEGFLARQRSRQADRLIPEAARAGRVLDIGFGTYPLFLSRTRFAHRYGLDRAVPTDLNETGLHLFAHDVETSRTLPFDTEFFDAVTMLAVFEHLDDQVLVDLLQEINRVLVSGGTFVMTTPARWTAGILNFMSRTRLVSGDEVGEHKDQYSHGQILKVLVRGGFDPNLIDRGSFEMGVNLWARARRSG